MQPVESLKVQSIRLVLTLLSLTIGRALGLDPVNDIAGSYSDLLGI